MNKANRYIDYTFKDASETYLNEDNLIKQYSDQIDAESRVPGKLLFRTEETPFDSKW